MIKNILFIFFCLVTITNYSQDNTPKNVHEVIKWDFDIRYTSANTAIIVIDVTQKNGWYILGQIQPEGSLAFPTSFNYNLNSNFELMGKTQEFGSTFREIGGFPENSFPGDKARFEQKIKINSKKKFKLTLNYNFMACNTMCFPPIQRTRTLVIRGTEGS